MELPERYATFNWLDRVGAPAKAGKPVEKPATKPPRDVFDVFPKGEPSKTQPSKMRVKKKSR